MAPSSSRHSLETALRSAPIFSADRDSFEHGAHDLFAGISSGLFEDFETGPFLVRAQSAVNEVPSCSCGGTDSSTEEAGAAVAADGGPLAWWSTTVEERLCGICGGRPVPEFLMPVPEFLQFETEEIVPKPKPPNRRIVDAGPPNRRIVDAVPDLLCVGSNEKIVPGTSEAIFPPCTESTRKSSTNTNVVGRAPSTCLSNLLLRRFAPVCIRPLYVDP